MSVGDLVDRVVIGRSQLGRRRIARRPGKVGNLLASHIERTGKFLFLGSRGCDASLDRGGKGRGIELFAQIRFNFGLIPRERRIELGGEFDGFAAERQRIGRFELAQQRPIGIRGFIRIGQEKVRDGAICSDATLLGRVGRTEGHRLESRLHVRVAERRELGGKHIDDIDVGTVGWARLPGGELLLCLGERLGIRRRRRGGAALDSLSKAIGVFRPPFAICHIAQNPLANHVLRDSQLARSSTLDCGITCRRMRGSRALTDIPLICELGILIVAELKLVLVAILIVIIV